MDCGFRLIINNKQPHAETPMAEFTDEMEGIDGLLKVRLR